jgi:hypothetical protein
MNNNKMATKHGESLNKLPSSVFLICSAIVYCTIAVCFAVAFFGKC